MDGAPVFCIGADVDIEFDAAVGVLGARVYQDILEADIEGAVGVGGEGVAIFAGDVAGAAVVVAQGVEDLNELVLALVFVVH